MLQGMPKFMSMDKKIGEINGKEALHVLKFPKQLLKASEWEIKVMRGKSDITPRFCSVRLVFE